MMAVTDNKLTLMLWHMVRTSNQTGRQELLITWISNHVFNLAYLGKGLAFTTSNCFPRRRGVAQATPWDEVIKCFIWQSEVIAHILLAYQFTMCMGFQTTYKQWIPNTEGQSQHCHWPCAQSFSLCFVYKKKAYISKYYCLGSLLIIGR